MKAPLAYTHPTLDDFLQFHLGPLAFAQKNADEAWSGRRVLEALDRKGFPFDHTCLGADVHRLEQDKLKSKNPTLMCSKGEPTLIALSFLADKRQTDRDNNHDRTYGPITIAATDNPEAVAAYYDAAVRNLFTSSVVQTLFADTTTMKISWYGQVNSYDQKQYLEAIINQLVHLQGISKLLASQLNTSRGATILTDSTRAASLAISVMRTLNPYASDRVIFTIGFACFVQHFGALFNNEQPFYPGKLYQGLDEATLAVFASLGLSEHQKSTLPDIDVDIQEVFHILRRAPDFTDKPDQRPSALYYCFWITNYLVATYFTEHTWVYEDDAYSSKRNPAYINADRTMHRLDTLFSDTAFFRFHRKKIERFIKNADRYYRLHMISRLGEGGYVSQTQLKALEKVKKRTGAQ